MKRYRDYRDYLAERKIPFGKPWVTRPEPEPEKPTNVTPLRKAAR